MELKKSTIYRLKSMLERGKEASVFTTYPFPYRLFPYCRKSQW